MGTCCIKGKKKQTNAKGFGGGPIYLDNDNREAQNRANFKQDARPRHEDPDPIAIKKDKNLSEAEREQRRLQALAAAEKRQMEIDMKGLSKEAYEEFKQKQRAAMESEKYRPNDDKALQWRAG